MPSIALPVSLRGQLLSGVRSAVAVFSPLDLFATGSQGIWLDPSDLSTMFSDRAGTTPVTTPGTVVGLRLDKSKGLVLGAELVGATSPSEIAANWTNNGGGSYTSNGTGYLRFTGLVTGKSYKVSFRVASYTSGSLLGFVDAPWDWNINAASQYATIRVASGGTVHFFGNSFVGSIDNISVKELPGNHAVAPTDAARPIYGVEPKGGRRNLLTFTELLFNAAWVKTTSPAVILTDQGSGVWRLQASAGSWLLYQSRASSGTHNFSIEVRSNGAGLDGFSLMLGSSAGGADRTATGDWVRYSASGLSGDIGIIRNSALAAVDVLIRFPQFETGSTATAYQRVTNDYDVTEAGVQTCHYCRYDGSNNSLSTSAIDFTGTDKMSVFAGVRKLSDATIGIVAELGPDSFQNVGGFYLAAPLGTGSGGNFAFWSRGSNQGGSPAQGAALAPIPRVVTGVADIAVDSRVIRLNGLQVGSDTGDQGTGNYGNYPLNFGRRMPSAVFPFNGKDYGIIIVGKAASAGEITNTELWLSDKTAEVDVAKSISPNIYTRSGDTILDRANSIIERRTV